MRAFARLSSLLGLVLLCGCSNAPEQIAPSATAPAPSALTNIAEHDRITVAAQPNADDLRALKTQGYTRIVNVRLPAEMADRAEVPFDEAALAAELGMDYVNLPIGGDEHPFRTEVVDGLKQALDGTEGRVFLHCAVGMRASLVYAGYAIKYLDADPDLALRETAQFEVWPLTLERLSGVQLKVVRVADQPVDAADHDDRQRR